MNAKAEQARLVAWLVLGAAFLGLAEAGDRSPVVLMPGYGGSKLEARWKDPSERFEGCEGWSGWRTIWVDYSWALPGKIQCLLKMIEPCFGDACDRHPLEVRVKDPERVESVEFLTDHALLGFEYFNQISNSLINELGYTRGFNLFGAPYDFRLAPNQLGDYYKRLEATIRTAYLIAALKPVTIICHSMGCLNALYFLHSKDQKWKDKHIARLITIGAPWAGSAKALRVALLGEKIVLGQMALVEGISLQKMSSSFPSTYFLMPREEVYGDSVLLMTKSNDGLNKRNFYTAKDIGKVIAEHKDHKSVALYEATKGLLDLKAPQVDVHCFWGEGDRTLSRIHFEGIFSQSDKFDYFGDGDGTVLASSGSYCKKWVGKQSKPVVTRAYKADHMNLLKNHELISDIISILSH